VKAARQQAPAKLFDEVSVGREWGSKWPHGALKMNRLHTNQRQCSAPREQASSARTGSKVNVFLKDAAQPVFFVGIGFRDGHEIAMHTSPASARKI